VGNLGIEEEYMADWKVNPTRYNLVADHCTEGSPAWV
jgi:hypothetical protein